jgi:hypothetical protein
MSLVPVQSIIELVEDAAPHLSVVQGRSRCPYLCVTTDKLSAFPDCKTDNFTDKIRQPWDRECTTTILRYKTIKARAKVRESSRGNSPLIINFSFKFNLPKSLSTILTKSLVTRMVTESRCQQRTIHQTMTIRSVPTNPVRR